MIKPVVIALFLLLEYQSKTIKDDQVYDMTEVDHPPEFIGGKTKFYAFLFNNFVSPKDEDSYMGSIIYLSFIIDKNGKLINAKIKKSTHPKIEAAILKALKKSPKWKPGLNNGIAVSVKYSTFVRLEPSP